MKEFRDNVERFEAAKKKNFVERRAFVTELNETN